MEFEEKYTLKLNLSLNVKDDTLFLDACIYVVAIV